MTIGELAKRANVIDQTVRFYERKGLLPKPYRLKSSGYRDYQEEDVKRLLLIRAVKEAGFTLKEVGEILKLEIIPNQACDDMMSLLDKKAEEVKSKMRNLKQVQKSLRALRTKCLTTRGSQPCQVIDHFKSRC